LCTSACLAFSLSTRRASGIITSHRNDLNGEDACYRTREKVGAANGRSLQRVFDRRILRRDVRGPRPAAPALPAFVRAAWGAIARRLRRALAPGRHRVPLPGYHFHRLQLAGWHRADLPVRSCATDHPAVRVATIRSWPAPARHGAEYVPARCLPRTADHARGAHSGRSRAWRGWLF